MGDVRDAIHLCAGSVVRMMWLEGASVMMVSQLVSLGLILMIANLIWLRMI